jgi:hypothetical protein
MKAMVTTILRQRIEVPEGATRESVLEFLADNQSFTDAFLGASDMNQQFRIVEINVVEEEITELGEETFDA